MLGLFTTTSLPAPVAAIETTIFTTSRMASGDANPASVPGGKPVIIRGILSLTPGVGATSVTVKCYQETAGGQIITGGLQNVFQVTAGVRTTLPLFFSDPTNYLQVAGGGQYVITVTQGAATGNGTSNFLALTVEE